MVPIERHSITHHSYDDESQLHNSATPCRLTDMRLYIGDRTGWVTDNNDAQARTLSHARSV